MTAAPDPNTAKGPANWLGQLSFRTARLHVVPLHADLPGLDADLQSVLTPTVLASLPASLQRQESENGVGHWVADRQAESPSFAILSARSGRCVGVLILFDTGDDGLNIGYLLGEDVWGQGLASELLLGLVSALSLRGPLRLEAGVEPGNTASARVLEKAGFGRTEAAAVNGALKYTRDIPAPPRIRDERPGDVSAILDLTRRAFAPKSFSDGSEPGMIDKLRADGELTLSLVAVDGEKVIGHVALSPAEISEAKGTWIGLGPISVELALQRRGIGKAMIETAAHILSQAGAAGIALTGDPAIYTRAGFTTDGTLHHEGTPDNCVLWRSLDGSRPAGRLRFAAAFGNDRG